MKRIQPEVLEAIRNFVSEGQSFTSLDIYCVLGVRIENEEYPIHQQVRDAYVHGLMNNYLSEWKEMEFEGGGFANIWRYYEPKANIKSFTLRPQKDGRVEITKEALGHFPLIEADINLEIQKDMIQLKLDADSPEKVFPQGERVRLTKELLRKANLLNKKLHVEIHSDHIDIREHI